MPGILDDAQVSPSETYLMLADSANGLAAAAERLEVLESQAVSGEIDGETYLAAAKPTALAAVLQMNALKQQVAAMGLTEPPIDPTDAIALAEGLEAPEVAEEDEE